MYIRQTLLSSSLITSSVLYEIVSVKKKAKGYDS
jgi:hypothetical protein